MAFWSESYKREERKRIEPGDYRVEITDVEITKSKSSGKDMLVVSVKPNGYDVTIKHYIVAGEWFNVNLTELKDSFSIAEDDDEYLGWVGAIGAARIKEDDQGYMKVNYFMNPKNAEKLPPWQGKFPERQKVTDFASEEEAGDDLPF